MHPMPPDMNWLDSREAVSLVELSTACGISSDDLVELIDYGALTPMPMQSERFSAHYIVQLRTVSRLRVDFDLDIFTAALFMKYLDRIEELEEELRSLKARSITTGQ
ncbi:MAG: chaperone modulator CbpM [Burkholderiaceae bacterium]